ncbi:unnamed protein product [Paramecium sonneborni]|uniref:Uncharacterized protein n=1 Tax=Paramecium sonneborni TaxID=65129 RepID=A0A8S1K5F6_9CILI|nr:unnamed protein product [Paramecium sonneborni]
MSHSKMNKKLIQSAQKSLKFNEIIECQANFLKMYNKYWLTQQKFALKISGKQRRERYLNKIDFGIQCSA